MPTTELARLLVRSPYSIISRASIINVTKEPSIEERFWSKVVKTESCWIWKAGKDTTGYGTFAVTGNDVRAHRFSYELLVGRIPEGLTIDHLCKNRACVNPYHMEPVTLGENIMRGNGTSARNARKTHCIWGHPLSGDNLLSAPLKQGRRQCKTCKREQQKRRE